MTKEQLKRYRALKLEMQDINSQIQLKSMQDSVQGSSKDFPYILQNHKVKGVPDEDYNLLVRKSDVKSQIKEIEEFVNGIEDNIVYQSINLKYIIIRKNKKGKVEPPLKWFQVAQEINCGLSGDGIRMKVDRFLKNI